MNENIAEYILATIFIIVFLYPNLTNVSMDFVIDGLTYIAMYALIVLQITVLIPNTGFRSLFNK